MSLSLSLMRLLVMLNEPFTHDRVDVVVGGCSKFAMSQLTKVCKVSRSILSPYVADILGAMLEALSMVEPAEFNYFAQRTNARSPTSLTHSQLVY